MYSNNYLIYQVKVMSMELFVVVSVKEKVPARRDQVSITETNPSEPLTKCRKLRDVIKTRGVSLTWDKLGGYLYLRDPCWPFPFKPACPYRYGPFWKISQKMSVMD
jgi:hypothetical protein